MQLLRAFQKVEAFGYRILLKADFLQSGDVPSGILERACQQRFWQNATHVAYDPADDTGGWLIVGEFAECVDLTAEHIDAVAA